MWSRRCKRIELVVATAERLVAEVEHVEWSPPRPVERLATAVPAVASLTDRLRRSLGTTRTSTIGCRGGALEVDGALVDLAAVEAVALLGWQQSAGAPRLWDISLLGPAEPLDLVEGHEEYETAAPLAEELAARLGIPCRESSCVGGTQEAVGSGAALSAPPRRCCI